MRVVDPKESLRRGRLVFRSQQRWDEGSSYGYRLPTGALAFHRRVRHRLSLLAGLSLAPLLPPNTAPPGLDVPTDHCIHAELCHAETTALAADLLERLPEGYRLEAQGLGRFLLLSDEIPLRLQLKPNKEGLQRLLDPLKPA